MVQTLFALMATLDDTNLLHRGGSEGLTSSRPRHGASSIVVASSDPTGAPGRSPSTACVARRLSPGGSADMLAAAWFVHSLRHRSGGHDARHPLPRPGHSIRTCCRCLAGNRQPRPCSRLLRRFSEGTCNSLSAREVTKSTAMWLLSRCSVPPNSRPGAPCATGCRPRASSPATASESLPPMPAPARSTPGKSWTWRGAVPRPWTGPARNRAACWRCAASPRSG